MSPTDDLGVDLERRAVLEFGRALGERLGFEPGVARDAQILLAHRFAEALLQRIASTSWRTCVPYCCATTFSGTLPGRNPCILTVRASRFSRLSTSLAISDSGSVTLRRRSSSPNLSRFACISSTTAYQVSALTGRTFGAAYRSTNTRSCAPFRGAKGGTRTPTPFGART